MTRSIPSDVVDTQLESLSGARVLVEACSRLFGAGVSSLDLKVTAKGVRLRITAPGQSGGSASVPSGPPLTPKFNVPGHQIIAQMAEDLLFDEAPEVLRRAVAIMTDDHDPKRRGFGSFAEYAAWPDTNKSDPDFKARTGKWHYIDLAYDPANPTAFPFALPGGESVVTAVAEQLELLRSSTDPTERADALAFVLHLVGDIHQPLHCIELHNTEFPEGDHGGNAFLLAKGKNLHSLWDAILAPRATDTKAAAQELLEQHPRSQFTTELARPDVADWVWESHALGREAYDKIIAEPKATRASRAYFDHARGVAEQRGPLAAYRLAQVLTAALDSA